MAKWCAIETAFRNTRIRPGREIDSDVDPGKAFVPVDDDAVSVRADAVKAAEEKAAAKALPAPEPEIPIPDDWLDLRPEQIVNLARKVGASGKCNRIQAIAFIEATLRKRRGEVDEPMSEPVAPAAVDSAAEPVED